MAVDGAMSLDTGPGGFRPVPVGVHGDISPGVPGFGYNGSKNCCTGLNLQATSLTGAGAIGWLLRGIIQSKAWTK